MNIEVLITVLVAILSYKIKLIDDRRNNNFEKYKNYIKRTILAPENRKDEKQKLYDSTETEAWLDKDIPCHMIYRFKKSENEIAILDYYQDYKDSVNDKHDIIFVIALNIVYLLLNNHLHVEWWTKLIITCVITSVSFYKCFKESNISIINNPLINVENSIRARIQRAKIKIMIENDYSKYKKNYFLN